MRAHVLAWIALGFSLLLVGCRTPPTVPEPTIPEPKAEEPLAQEPTTPDPPAPVIEWATDNLVTNAGFEDRLAGWRAARHTGWAPDAGIEGGGALVIRAPKPPDGPYIHTTKVSQCIPLHDGGWFSLSARFRSDRAPVKAPANRLNVIWYETNDCTKGGQFGSYLEPDPAVTDWQQLERTSLRPALDATAVRLEIAQRGRYSDGGHAYWDDITFVATAIAPPGRASPDPDVAPADTPPPGTNYLVNGSFDSDLDAWYLGAFDPAWSRDGAVGPGSLRATARSESGSSGAGVLGQCVDLGANQRFELGASVKRDASSSQRGGGRLRLIWYERGGCGGRGKIERRHANPTEDPGWQQLRVESLARPASAHSAKVQLIQSVLGAGESSMNWDDVYLEAVE